MRILHVIESMQMGGAERHLANLLGPLDQLGVDNEVALLWSGDAYSDSVRPFARVHDLRLVPRQVWPALPRLLQLARRADVVHTQLPWADIAGRLAALGARKPSVTTLQTTWYDPANLPSFAPAIRRRVGMVRRLDALTARATRRFFAVSEATARVYIEGLGFARSKVEVIPNTVDLAQFDTRALAPRAQLRAALGCGADELALLMVARLVPPKGHAEAITAVARLRDQLPLKLYIAGTGPEEERLRQLAAAERAPVVFLGPRADVPQLLGAADLFLFPSVIEGMPLALIEAMAMGTACLCSDIAENREAGGDALAYVPPSDVTALTRALAALLRDPPRRRALGQTARARAERYSSRTVAARLLRSIEDVLAGRDVVAARDYNYPVHRLLADAAARHLGDFDGRVLDVGCGTAPYRALLPAGVDHVGIDRRGGANVRLRADFDALPFADASFDGVLCTEVLEQSPRPWQTMAELARVLRPGGRLYLTAPFDWHFFDEPRDYFRFTTHGLRALCEAAGLRVQVMEPVGGMFSAFGGKLLENVVQGAWLPLAGALGIRRGAYLAAALASLPWNLASRLLLPRLDRASRRNPFAVALVAVR